MEPIKATIEVAVFYTKVVRIEKRSRRIYLNGFGKEATFHDQDLGWWMLLADSHEALYMGEMRPFLKGGDKVKVTIAKEELDAELSQSSK